MIRQLSSKQDEVNMKCLEQDGLTLWVSIRVKRGLLCHGEHDSIRYGDH